MKNKPDATSEAPVRLERFSVQTTPEDHARLKTKAKANGRSKSAEANYRLIESMNAEDRKKK